MPVGATPVRVVGIVLAAGSSSRLGRPKQLLDLGGEPVIRHTVRALLASRLSDLIVVVGHAANDVASALAGLPVTVVANPSYADGQSTSVVAGLRVATSTADAVVFALGDQPEVQAEWVDALIERFSERGAPIVQPVYGTTPGNPVLFGRALFHELETISGDQGARAVIRVHADVVDRVRVSDGPSPADIDTEQDYQALQERWSDRSTV